MSHESLREILESYTTESASNVDHILELIEALPEFQVNEAALTLLVEYEAALKSQGLPSDTSVEVFVQHHRGNAGVAVAFQELGKQLKAQREQIEIDAQLVETTLTASPSASGADIAALLRAQFGSVS